MKTRAVLYCCLVLAVTALFATQAHCQCSLRTDQDFSPNSPLLISNDSFVYPSKRTAPTTLTLAVNQRQEAFCSTAAGFLQINGRSIGKSSLTLSCVGNAQQFSDIQCSREPASSTRNLGSCSLGANVVVEIGFQITKDNFTRIIDLCFNTSRGQPIWAHAVITGAIDGRQTQGGHRPNFRAADYYRDIPVAQAYARNSQRQMLLGILGRNQALVDRYIPTKGNNFFARGHLIARADMYYTAQQHATFYYVNVLPMWQSINAANWELVEDSIRRIARNYGHIEVWTGSLYDLELAYTSTKNRMIYLATNDKGEPALVVPRLLFKVAYQGATNRAIVYVTANNPYLNDTNLNGYQVCNEYQTCRQNVARFNDIERGFTYCCLWSDFIRDPYAATLGLPDLANPAALQ